MGIPPELGAGRHAARGSVPHLRRPDSSGARLAPGARRGVERRPARRRGQTEAWPARSAAAAAAGPRHGLQAGRRQAGGGRIPRPPRRPVPPGLSAAEERPVRATAAAAPTSPRRGHGGRRAGRLPALPDRRPGPGGGDGLGKRFRFKQLRRVSALAIVGYGQRAWAGAALGPARGGAVRPGGCSAPAPPCRRPVAAPSRCPGSRSRPGGRCGPAPRACVGSVPRARLMRAREPRPSRGRSTSRCPSSPASGLASPGLTLGRVLCGGRVLRAARPRRVGCGLGAPEAELTTLGRQEWGGLFSFLSS